MNKHLLLKSGIAFMALSLGGLSPCAIRAEEIAVVMSANLKPYQAALAGFENALGRSVPVFSLSEGSVALPPEARVVLAIGGKAALEMHPRDIALVYCLAPGILLSSVDRKTPLIKVYMTPSASVVMRQIKEIQSSLQTLGVLGLTESRDEFNKQLDQAGVSSGVRVLVEKMRTPNDLPHHLRVLRPQIDALWIPPDPRLITLQNFNIIKEFSLSTRIPFYVPTSELAEQGAVAAVASSFDQIGQAAAQTIRDVLSGKVKSGKVYPEKYHTTVNAKSAAECGVKLSPDLLKKINRLVP